MRDEAYKDLRRGDWVLMLFGTERMVFYVLSVTDGSYLMGKTSWLVSGCQWFEREALQGRGVEKLGRGKARWWWPLLPFINDLICPFSKP